MNAHTTEITRISVGRTHDQVPVALVQLRIDPDQSKDQTMLAFTHEQVLRLWNTLGGYLADPDCWLYTPPDHRVDKLEVGQPRMY